MIGISNISQTLGEDSYDLGTLCRSDNINKWSFRKPVNLNKLAPLTNQDFYSVNSGFNLYSYNSPQQLLYEAQNPQLSTLWDYSPRTAPFRLGDFFEYDHYADPMFTLEWVSDSYGPVGTSLRFSSNSDCYTFVKRWAYFDGVHSYVDFVLLIYQAGTQYNQSGSQGVGILKLASGIDLDAGNDSLHFRIPSGLSTGLYEMRLCFSTATSGWMDGEYQWYNPNSNPLYGFWYALPEHSKLSFNVNSGGGGGGGTGGTGDDLFQYVDFSFSNLQYDFYDPDLWNLSFDNVVSVLASPDGDDSTEIIVHVEYNYTNCVQGTVLLGSESFTLVESGQAWKTINISHPDNIETIFTASLDNDEISISVSADITIKGKTQNRTWTQRISK